MLWGLLIVGIVIVLGLGMFYMYLQFRAVLMNGRKAKDFPPKTRRHKSCIAAIPVAVLVLLCVIRPYYWVVPVLHLLVGWTILRVIVEIVEKVLTKRDQKKNLIEESEPTEGEDKETRAPRRHIPLWIPCVLALAMTIVYMSIAYYLAMHVCQTNYQIATNKDVSDLRIALIADSHVGVCFDGDGFAKHLETIQAQNPDLLVICGDFVDDDSIREDMLAACEALGKFQSTYGVFYVPGNHDRGYGNSRDFTYDELTASLEQNDVTVLEDEIVPIGEDYYLVGRKDRSMKRMPIEKLISPLDPSRYTIVLNHQPNDYDAEAEAGCDLVLSGHTHGGQLIPIGVMGELIGANDATYGKERRKNTTFIITSGIADWAIPYKSGTISEYCIIDISNEET